MISVFIFAIALTAVSARTSCRLDTECAATECCYYHEGPLIMSRRQLTSSLSLTDMVQGGWCEKYRLEGESCSVFGKMNGHCECGPNLTCTFVPAPTSTMTPSIGHIIFKKSMVFMGPGSYRCVRAPTTTTSSSMP